LINNRPAGLWMLPAHVGTSRSTLAALQRDFARLRTLDHPHIARLLELGCNGQQYYVTGERLDGEPLRDVLTHLLPDRLDVGEADDVVRAIGSALLYAHEHGVVHGDVRAENVIVTMDRRFVLTNFLARRIAKATARPPRPGDDLAGLARLAAELYTGSTSPQALRAAAHSGVPAARLNAIRSVLETPSRRSSGVTEFLAAAGLALGSARATRRSAAPGAPWPLWRFAVPVAAVIAVGAIVGGYHAAGSAWRESASELQRRGIDALRTVGTKATAPAPAESPEPEAPQSDVGGGAASSATSSMAPAGGANSSATSSMGPANANPPDTAIDERVLDEATVEPASDPIPTAAPTPRAPALPAPSLQTVAATRSAPMQRVEPAVLSMGVPKIAAREDHTVVAIDVVRSGDITGETAVGWWTAPDTAHPDDDYATGGRQIVTFPVGATVERLLIPIVNDGKRESDEVFTVHLSEPRNAVTGEVAATRVTLLDDD
jgi:hypothetical protein